MDKIKLPLLLALSSGVILAFSLPIFPWGGLVFFGFIPLFLGLQILPNRRGSFKLGLMAGLIYFAPVYKWFLDAYPLDQFGLNNRLLAGLMIFLIWALTTLVLALFWGLFSWLAKRIEPKLTWLSLLILPSLFMVAEYGRSFVIGTLWSKPGMIIGPHWTAGNLAYNLHQSTLFLKASSGLGIYGLTFLIIFINLLFFIFLEKKYLRKTAILFALVLGAFFLNPKLGAVSPATVRVAAIQTRIPSQASYSGQEQLSFLRQELELLATISQKYPETKLIVFPEGSNFFTGVSILSNTLSASQYFEHLFPSSVLILDNAKIREGTSLRSKTIFLDSKKGIVASYDKYLLTPGGEYVPSLFLWVDKVLGLESVALKEADQFERGDHPPLAIRSGDLAPGPLICSDLASPSLARQLSRSDNNLITVQASLAFAHGSENLAKQTKALAQFRAAENERSLIYSANFGPSYLISPGGEVVAQTNSRNFEILTGPLVLNSKKTLYNELGDDPWIMAGLNVLILGLFWREKDKGKSYAHHQNG